MWEIEENFEEPNIYLQTNKLTYFDDLLNGNQRLYSVILP